MSPGAVARRYLSQASRAERVGLGVGALCLALGLGFWPLLRALDLSLAFDLSLRLHGDLDPWGRPVRWLPTEGLPGRAALSAGPDGVDQDGGGDDLGGRRPWPSSPLGDLLREHPTLHVFARSHVLPTARPVLLGLGALAFTWLPLVGRLSRAPRAGLPGELARAGFVALGPAALAGYAALPHVDTVTRGLTLPTSGLALPLPLTVFASAYAGVALFVLWARLRATEPESAPSPEGPAP